LPSSKSTCCGCAPAKEWAIARANGKLKGKAPKLSARQQTHLLRLHQAGEHTIAEIAELFSVSRATVYREIARRRGNRP
jgi:DNA invertase Pin-like site-specific DNA recombinase